LYGISDASFIILPHRRTVPHHLPRSRKKSESVVKRKAIGPENTTNNNDPFSHRVRFAKFNTRKMTIDNPADDFGLSHDPPFSLFLLPPSRSA
ncbi:hypothetical protein GWI33_010435, partial [Rhynchophorus ferrugineus]